MLSQRVLFSVFIFLTYAFCENTTMEATFDFVQMHCNSRNYSKGTKEQILVAKSQYHDEKDEIKDGLRRTIKCIHDNPNDIIGGVVTLSQNVAILLKQRGHFVEFYHHPNLRLFESLKLNIKTCILRNRKSLIEKLFVVVFNLLNNFANWGKKDDLVAINFKVSIFSRLALNFNKNGIILDSIGSSNFVAKKISNKLHRICNGISTCNKVSFRLVQIIYKMIASCEPNNAILPSNYYLQNVIEETEPFASLGNSFSAAVMAPFFSWQTQNVKLMRVKKNGELFRFSMLNRFSPEKKIELAIEAMEHLKNYNRTYQDLNFKLNIIGAINNKIDEEYLKYLKGLAEEKNLTDIVDFHTHTKENNDEIKALLNESDVHIHTRLGEPRAIVIFESMIKGKPVICFESGGNNETVIENINGLMSKELTTQGLSKKILKYMHDESIRRQLSAKTSLSIIENYTEDKYYENLKPIVQMY